MSRSILKSGSHADPKDKPPGRTLPEELAGSQRLPGDGQEERQIDGEAKMDGEAVGSRESELDDDSLT